MHFPLSLWPPAIVVPYPGSLGRAFWFLVLMPPTGSKRLLRHELWHVRQDYVTLGLRPFLAMFLRDFRFRCEASAYGESLRHTPEDQRERELERYAKFLSDHYGTGKTVAQAREAIYRYERNKKLF